MKTNGEPEMKVKSPANTKQFTNIAPTQRRLEKKVRAFATRRVNANACVSGARSDSPKPSHVATVSSVPKPPKVKKIARQPKRSRSRPPTLGATKGASAKTMVT